MSNAAGIPEYLTFAAWGANSWSSFMENVGFSEIVNEEAIFEGRSVGRPTHFLQ